MNDGGCESDILQRPEKCQFYPLGPRRGEIISNQTKQFLLPHLVHFKCHPLGQNYY